MGYVPEETVYVLKFEDPKLHGLVVKMTAPTIGGFTALTLLAGLDVDNLKPEDVGKVDAIFTTLAEHLVEWNVEKPKGTPVPATLEGLRMQHSPLVFAIFQAWMELVAGIPAPKGPSSNGGGPFPAVSLPMEPLSASPQR